MPKIHKCTHFPYPIGNVHPEYGKVIMRPEKVLPAAYKFIEEWKAETPEPHHYVQVRCFGEPYQKVFINSAFIHTEKKNNPRNLARRYRFLPCVKDLLMNSKHTPDPTRDGNLSLIGKINSSRTQKELFMVILGSYPVTLEPDLEGYNLLSFFPIT